ncbi:DUF421 domain-containing protein [Thalassorhabdus alkalitolerans]|uniref:DUF421 domain-containing protein n=1 Tax=Thalassorhabdus alkalitolerans TaxID=2282697 RepID=UPI0006D0AFF7
MLEFWTGSEALPITGFVIRAIIVYIYIFLMVKILGQRSMGSIDPLDFIFGVVIGDIVGEPLSSGDLPLGGPLASAGLIAAFHFTLTYTALKTPRFRRVIEDEPLIVIEKGKILHDQLKKAKVTIESLLMDLRLRDASDLNEVDYAILEANGQISVIKKSANQALTPTDMNMDPKDKGYPKVIIEDGKIIHANLKELGSIDWLKEELLKRGHRNPHEIFLLTIDETSGWYISPKQQV